MFKERANDSGVDNAIRYARLIGTKTMSARVYCAREMQSDIASIELLLKVRVSEHSGSFGKYHRLGSIIVILDRFTVRTFCRFHRFEKQPSVTYASKVHFRYSRNNEHLSLAIIRRAILFLEIGNRLHSIEARIRDSYFRRV